MENLQSNPVFLLVLGVLLGAGIIYGGYNIWFNDMEEEREALIQQIGELKKEVEEGRRLEAKLPELQAEIKAKEEELERLKKILPPQKDTEKLVRKLERMAAEAGLQIQTWASLAVRQQEFYQEWPIAVEVEGGYHNLAKFYAMLSNYARIINVANIRIARITRGAQDESTIDASFTATTYVYKEPDQKPRPQ